MPNNLRSSMRVVTALVLFILACCAKADVIVEQEPNDTRQTANLTVGNGDLAVDATYDGTPDNFSFVVAKLAPNTDPYDGWVSITIVGPSPSSFFCFEVLDWQGYAAIGGCAPSPIVLDFYPAVQGGIGVYDLAIDSINVIGSYHVSIVATSNPGHQPPTLLGSMPAPWLPFPAVEILHGPPPGNYCNATRATALFSVNTRPGEQYFGQGTFEVNGQVVFVSPLGVFSFPAGALTAEYPLPLEVLPGGIYAPGTVFTTISRYFDSSMRATYENEIAIQCDTGATMLIRNSDLTVPPALVSAVSRKAHGAAGTFDLPLSPLLAAPTTEPRRGPTQTIVFTFDRPITGATVTITEGSAIVGATTFSGNDVVVDLTGVTNQQYITVALTNVAPTDGATGGSGIVRVGFLLGDVNQNRVVTVADLGMVNAQLTQFVTAANFLKDVNASGAVTVSDKGITNANLAKALPAP